MFVNVFGNFWSVISLSPYCNVFPKAKFLGKISNSQDRIVLHISFRSDEGLSIESSALKLFMVANLHY